MSKITVLLNQKGGVSKTTTTLSLAAYLSAKMKMKILAIDFDPQANLTQSIAIKESQQNIYRILKGDSKYNPVKFSDYLHVIPSHIDLTAFETEMSAEPGREYILRDFLSGIKNTYDFIFIDCSPSLGLTTMNALACADTFLIPITPEPFAVNGLSRLIKVTEKINARLNPNLRLEGILVTKFEKRVIINQQTMEVLQKHFKDKVYNTVIHKNVALVESTSAK